MKKPLQGNSQSGGPDYAAESHPQPVAQPQISLADAKAEFQPGNKEPQEKDGVGKMGVSGAQRLQKAVQQPQPGTDTAGDKQPPGGDFWGRHPNSRRSQPPPEWGSS